MYHWIRAYYLYISAFIAFLIVSVALWYSNRLVSQLAKEEEKRVTFYAEVLKFIGNNETCEAFFLFQNLVKVNETVPAIITDSLGNPTADNYKTDSTWTAEKRKQFILSELKQMKENTVHPRIPIEYAPGKFNYIYYRESDLLIQLRNYPYIAIFVITVFISVVFFAFWIAQRNEQNRVWAGLAKETAHQLGTPISGLLAWVEFLKCKENPDEVDLLVAEELGKDVKRLQTIAERFSKIGSEPELVLTKVNELITHVVDYVGKRAPQSKKFRFSFDSSLPEHFAAKINPILMEWVIENLLKNALDAIPSDKEGFILVTAKAKNQWLEIDIEDSGKGIPPEQIHRVFQPGFTTKKRGWGLGLSLSKRIIENYHKGKIFVKRSELGKGTTFRIQIPI